MFLSCVYWVCIILLAYIQIWCQCLILTYAFYSISFFKGHTDDFAIMIENLSQKYSNSNIVACGFSLGGNLVTKYLGEKQRMKPSNVVGGISICQGYNAVEYV